MGVRLVAVLAEANTTKLKGKSCPKTPSGFSDAVKRTALATQLTPKRAGSGRGAGGYDIQIEMLNLLSDHAKNSSKKTPITSDAGREKMQSAIEPTRDAQCGNGGARIPREKGPQRLVIGNVIPIVLGQLKEKRLTQGEQRCLFRPS